MNSKTNKVLWIFKNISNIKFHIENNIGENRWLLLRFFSFLLLLSGIPNHLTKGKKVSEMSVHISTCHLKSQQRVSNTAKIRLRHTKSETISKDASPSEDTNGSLKKEFCISKKDFCVLCHKPKRVFQSQNSFSGGVKKKWDLTWKKICSRCSITKLSQSHNSKRIFDISPEFWRQFSPSPVDAKYSRSFTHTPEKNELSWCKIQHNNLECMMTSWNAFSWLANKIVCAHIILNAGKAGTKKSKRKPFGTGKTWQKHVTKSDFENFFLFKFKSWLN